jgi:filamentous hemagglutinin
MSAARARALVREVQRHDPSWRPQPSIYQGVEGQIRVNEWETQLAIQRLQQLGRSPPDGRPLSEVLLPGGRPIGTRDGGAGDGIRTVSQREFESMLEALSPGAQVVPSPSTYKGLWYQRPDGSIFGIRRSDEHGMTFEVIRSNHPTVRNGDKVHQK